MKCPNCNETLAPKTSDDLEMTVCSQCAGVWFAGDELNRMKDLSLPDANWLDFNLWKDIETMKFSLGERACPQCGKTMARMGYGETGVTIPEYLRETLEEGRELIAGTEGSHHDWKDFTTVVRLLSRRLLAEHPNLARALAEFSLSSPK